MFISSCKVFWCMVFWKNKNWMVHLKSSFYNKIWVLILNNFIQAWQFDTSSTWNPFITRRHKWWWQDSFRQSTWPLKIDTISWSRGTYTWSIPNPSGRFREAMPTSEKEYFLFENSQGWINNCTKCFTSVCLKSPFNHVLKWYTKPMSPLWL